MKCISGKNGYYSESEVQEALVRSHIRFQDAAKNYYLCDDCNEYHLTSQSNQHPLLADPEVQKRIKKERSEQEWMNHLRKN